MQVKFENGRLNMMPEDNKEERFCRRLINRLTDSNLLMGWYGDVRFGEKETSGYIITTLPSVKEGEKGIAAKQ